jgi:hypothetical protein
MLKNWWEWNWNSCWRYLQKISFYFSQNVWKCSIFWAHAFKICKKFQYKSKLAKSNHLIILLIAVTLSQNPTEIQKSIKLMHLTGHGAYLNHMCVEKSILCIPFTFNSSIHLFMGHLMHHPKKSVSRLVSIHQKHASGPVPDIKCLHKAIKHWKTRDSTES